MSSSSGTHPSRRILITGLSSTWGGRLAQLLEQEESLEVLIGVDTADPRHELRRTEFVRVGADDTLLRRIIRAAGVDTVLDLRASDPGSAPARARGESAGLRATRTLLAACAGADSPVRKLILRSSADFYGAGRADPAFFGEEMTRSRTPQTEGEWDVALAEAAVGEFARDNPAATVTVLRLATAIGSDLRSPHLALLGLPVLPGILGYDPRWQFVHEEDVLGALRHGVLHTLPGPYNLAADGVLALSEVAGLLGKPLVPVLPPWGSVLGAVWLRRLGLPMSVELVRDLRYGRGLDNRRLKLAGYRYRYTSREAVLKLRAQQRLRPLLGSGEERYRYEREVEAFLRWSPSVRRALEAGGSSRRSEPPAQGASNDAGSEQAPDPYSTLSESELLEVIPSLDIESARRLREHEAAGPARERILEELDQRLAPRAGR